MMEGQEQGAKKKKKKEQGASRFSGVLTSAGWRCLVMVYLHGRSLRAAKEMKPIHEVRNLMHASAQKTQHSTPFLLFIQLVLWT